MFGLVRNGSALFGFESKPNKPQNNPNSKEQMSYKELDVWKASRSLVADVYNLTREFPQSEQFGLTSQIRRAAVSISANIAEGYGRKTPGAYAQFLRTAKGSVNELETLILLSQDLGFVNDQELLLCAIAKVGSMLTNLIAKIESSAVREDIAAYQT